MSKTRDEEKTFHAKFKPSTAAEKAFYRQLKKVAQVAGHIIESHTDGVKIKNSKELQEELLRYSKKLEPWARRQSAKMLETVQRSNKRAYTVRSKQIGRLIEAEGFGPIGNVALVLMNEQVNLIKSIPLEAGLRAQKIALEAVLHGTRAVPDEDTIAELEKQMGMSTEVATTRAMLIARTETARANAAFNQSRAMNIGSTHYRWRNSGDESVRPSHKKLKGKKLDGMIFAWSSPPTLDDGMTGHPGTFPNCFPGLTQLNSSPFIQKFYRHRYSGELSQMVLADGKTLLATPNHPVFTGVGIKAIKDIDPGEYVVCAKQKRGNAADVHVDRLNFTFEQLFNTVSALPVFIKSSIIGGEFHGDVTDEKIDIINPDSRLILERNTAVQEKLLKLGFSVSDVRLMRSILKGDGGSHSDIRAFLFSTDSRMGSVDLLMSLLRAHFTPLDLFCLALGPHFDAGLNEMLTNDESRDFMIFGDSVFAYSFLVHGFDAIAIQVNHALQRTNSSAGASAYSARAKLFSDKLRINFEDGGNLDEGFSSLYEFHRVFKKDVVPFSGHVFNLQTVSGYYSAENMFQENCRCYSEVILPE